MGGGGSEKSWAGRPLPPATSLLLADCSSPLEVPSGIFLLPVWLLPVVIQEGSPKMPTWLFAWGPSPLWAILPVLMSRVSPALDGFRQSTGVQ